MTTPDTKLYVLTYADGDLGLIGPFDDADAASRAGMKWRQTAIGDAFWWGRVCLTDAQVRSPLPLTAPEREPRVSWEVLDRHGNSYPFRTENSAHEFVSERPGWTVVRMEDLTYGKR